MVVVGIVDAVQSAGSAKERGMRLGIVRGHVTLTPAVACISGRTLVILEPVTMENLRAKNGMGGGKSLIAVDELGAAEGPDGGVYRGPRSRQSLLARRRCRWTRIVR